MKTIELHFKTFEDKNCDVIFVRKLGVGICFLISVSNDIRVDTTTKLVYRLNLNKVIEEIKTKI